MNKIIFIIPVVIVIFFLNTIEMDSENKTAIYVSLNDCNVQNKKCRVELDNFNVEISLDDNIFYLKRFYFNVGIIGKEKNKIESIHIYFKMKNMNMGDNKFILNRVESVEVKQNWKGSALLPICVSGRADWFSELVINTSEYKYIIEFPILVKKQQAN